MNFTYCCLCVPSSNLDQWVFCRIVMPNSCIFYVFKVFDYPIRTLESPCKMPKTHSNKSFSPIHSNQISDKSRSHPWNQEIPLLSCQRSPEPLNLSPKEHRDHGTPSRVFRSLACRSALTKDFRTWVDSFI